MSILHADNFTIYGTNPAFMLNGVYAEANCTLVTDPDGVSGGLVMSQNPNAGANETVPFRYVFQNGALETVGIAFRIWMTQLPNSDAKKFAISVNNSENYVRARMWFTSTGRIAIDLDGGATQYSTAPVVTANGWYHIEWRQHEVGTSIEYEVRVEGLTVMSGSLTVTDTGYPKDQSQIQLSTSNISRNYTAFIKDFVVWDTLGTYNTDFIGSCLVTNLEPTSDVSLNWSPSTGTTGWDILDNTPPDDSKYISADIAHIGSAYVGGLSDLPADVTSVKALITYVRAAKTDGGDGSLQSGIVTGPGTATNGANRPITIAQTYWRDVFEINPDTSAPWLPAAVNASKVRINRTV